MSTLNIMFFSINTLNIVYSKPMRTFGENLKKERKIAGLNQKDFAEKLGTTQQRVSEWECGKVEPTLYNIIAIIRVLDITFEDLISGIEK